MKNINGLDQIGTGEFSADTSSTYVTIKVVNIVDWNMDSTATKTVAHGLSATEWKRIKNVSAIIRDDSDTTYFGISSGGVVSWVAGSEPTDCFIWNIGSTNITLARKGSGDFDNTSYDSTGGFVRGWVTIFYIKD